MSGARLQKQICRFARSLFERGLTACAEVAEKERSMLRYLEIPEEWMPRYGMASQWVGRRKRRLQFPRVG